MLIKNRSKCPVCDSTIPFWLHLFYGDITGLVCPTCNSIIGHMLRVKIIKFSLLALNVISLSNLGSDNYIIWWFIFSLSLILLLYVQLYSRFKIVFENKSRKKWAQ
jgi:hypothetical protein